MTPLGFGNRFYRKQEFLKHLSESCSAVGFKVRPTLYMEVNSYFFPPRSELSAATFLLTVFKVCGQVKCLSVPSSESSSVSSQEFVWSGCWGWLLGILETEFSFSGNQIVELKLAYGQFCIELGIESLSAGPWVGAFAHGSAAFLGGLHQNPSKTRGNVTTISSLLPPGASRFL